MGVVGGARERVVGPEYKTNLCQYLSSAVDPPLFDEEDAALAARISGGVDFSTFHGSHTHVTLDGGFPRWSTEPGSGEGWPCAEHPYATAAECAATPNALFCQRANCQPTNDAARKTLATVNQRIVQALVVLKGLTQGDFQKIRLPLQMQGADFRQMMANRQDGVLSRYDTTTFLLTRFESDLRTYTDRVGGSSQLPVFWRHFPPTSTTPVIFGITPGSSPAGNTNIEFIRSLDGPSAPVTAGLWMVPASDSLCGTYPLSREATSPGSPYYSPLPQGLGSSAGVLAGTDPDLPYLTTRFRYDRSSILDAAELLCEASRNVIRSSSVPPVGAGAAACPVFDPKTLTTADQFKQVLDYVACRTREFERSIGASIIPRVPTRVISGLHAQGGETTFPAVGGRMGAQMLRLRAALIRFGEYGTTMRDAGVALNEALERMDIALRQVQVRGQQEALDLAAADLQTFQARLKIGQIEFQQSAAMARAATDCAMGLTTGLMALASESLGGIMGSVASCVEAQVAAGQEVQSLDWEKRITQVEESLAQIDRQRSELDGVYTQLDAANALAIARSEVRSIAKSTADVAREAMASLEEIRAAATELEGLRLQAVRAVGRAIQFQSTQAAVTENIDAVLSAKLDVSKARYNQAHKNAVRLAFLAKRAIEQRLGVHLSELRADLPLVDAPSSWEAQICTAEGIDYRALRKTDSGPEAAKNFAAAYIGDYLTKLRNVVESYRLQYDFQEGTDEVVASLRDDILHVRSLCPQSLGNLLTYSNAMDKLTSNPGGPGWRIVDCPIDAEGATSADCIRIERTPDVPLSIGAKFGTAPGFQFTLGSGSGPGTRLSQRLKLSPGRHRLSWYTQDNSYPAADVRMPQVAPLRFGNPAVDYWSVPAAGTWRRFYRFFDVPRELDVDIQITPWAKVAAVMLEALPSSEQAADDPKYLPPPAFVATADTTERMVPVCEDTDGSVFREKAWSYRCSKLCRDGFSEGCAQTDSVDRCYWETLVSVDQRDLESGLIFTNSGFARGNFNYRIEELAVNFVGTEVRDCSDSETPSSCYAAGFIPYSLKHVGPLFVRNYEGADFNVKLFTGNIEHARGLGIERYLTNPLSSTDRELLSPYVRTEFQGRPLDGSFILRVWDEPGVNFDAIADVQLYLKYRYWTRFN